MRVIPRALLVVFVTLIVAAAPAGAAVDAKTVPIKQWSGSVCTDFSRWDAKLAKLGATGTPADPAAARKAITTFLKGAVKATDTLAKQLRADGVPKVEDGKAIAATFANSVKSLRASYAEAKVAAKALPTDDAAVFSLGLRSLAAQLQTSGGALATALSEAATQYPSSALDEAFTTTKACAALR